MAHLGNARAPADDRILPVRHQGEALGALSVSKRPGQTAHADRGTAARGPGRPGAPYVLAIRKGAMTVCAAYWRQANTAEQVKESP